MSKESIVKAMYELEEAHPWLGNDELNVLVLMFLEKYLIHHRGVVDDYVEGKLKSYITKSKEEVKELFEYEEKSRGIRKGLAEILGGTSKERSELEKLRRHLELQFANEHQMTDESIYHIFVMKLLNLCEEEIRDGDD